MKLLVDMLHSVDCIEMDLHTDKSDPEFDDFGYLNLECFRPLDLILGETIWFKEVEFILDEVEHIEKFNRANKEDVCEYYMYRFDVAAEARRHEERLKQRELEKSMKNAAGQTLHQ